MNEIVFVMAPMHNVFFEELADVFSQELRGLGVRTSFSRGFAAPEPGRAYVLIAPHEHLILAGEGGVPVEPLSRTVCICTEQPGTSWFEGAARIARRAGAAFDINRRGAELLSERGIRAEYLPLGYSLVWDRFGSADRDLDLLFLGGATERRTRLLAFYGSTMVEFKTRLLMADTQIPQTAGSPGLAEGERKLELLSRTRVLLNLHRGPAPYFEWFRVLEAIHCGAMVVSEPSRDYEPLIPGEHLLFGRADSLHHVAREALEDEDTRARIAAEAHVFIRDQLPLRHSAEQLAAAAERVADNPLGSGWSGRRRVRSAPLEPRLRDVISAARRSDGGTGRLRIALKRARLEVMGLNRRLDTLLAERGNGAPPSSTTVVAQTAAYENAAPRIAVICALYNHAGHIAAALDSVAAQRFNDWELVVCDDGSTDQSGSVAESWIEEHPKSAAALIRHSVNRGLPAARNSAVERARGEYVLVLDADNELYPHCMERLVGALEDDPEAAFAYGILEQFDRSGPVGLSGYFTWEPERLAEENYIDALALISRQRLEELGGYSTDRRLYGWEDYDLWCRIAERGGHAAHVPEIVARYRLAPGSMISLTNLSVRDAREAIAERSPNLFEGVDLERFGLPPRGAEKAIAALEAKRAEAEAPSEEQPQ